MKNGRCRLCHTTCVETGQHWVKSGCDYREKGSQGGRVRETGVLSVLQNEATQGKGRQDLHNAVNRTEYRASWERATCFTQFSGSRNMRSTTCGQCTLGTHAATIQCSSGHSMQKQPFNAVATIQCRNNNSMQ